MLRSGNRKALGQLYNRYRQRLMKHCTRLLNDEQGAEDIVQNVFLKLQMERQSIRNGQSLQSWMFTVARNEAFSILQKKRLITIDDTVVWSGDSPIDELLSKEGKDVIDVVIQRLHAPFREVILLREYEHLSYEEIAGITNTTLSSVRSRLFKARKALIEKLRPYFIERDL